MKSLPIYINEKLIIKPKQIITPNSKQELKTAILDHFKLHNGDLNDIDVSDLKEEDFYHLFYDLNDEINDNNITEIDISDWDLKELYWDHQSQRNMFECCDTLKTIILPDCLEVIDQFTFYYCKKLKNIIIPDSVTKIGTGALEGCSSMTSIVIPDSVTSIGYNAFYNCPKLTITVPNERVKELVVDSRFDGKIIIK